MSSNKSVSQALATAHQLTQSEREQGLLYLKQTHNGIIGAIKGVSSAQWQFTPTPSCWSIAQVVEHINFVLERVGGPLRNLLAQAQPPPADWDFKYVDEVVIHHFPTRLAKFPVPEFARPGNRFQSPPEALRALAQSYSDLAQYLEQTPDLRAHALEAPPLKAVTNGVHDLLDGYQWILAAAAHADRHTKQILEVKAGKNFPANYMSPTNDW